MTVRKFIICDICGKEGARARRVTRSYGRGTDLLVIEKVPVITCPNCGENYLTGATLHELERIKRDRKKLSSIRPVAVANFGKYRSPNGVRRNPASSVARREI